MTWKDFEIYICIITVIGIWIEDVDDVIGDWINEFCWLKFWNFVEFSQMNLQKHRSSSLRRLSLNLQVASANKKRNSFLEEPIVNEINKSEEDSKIEFQSPFQVPFPFELT